MHSYYDKEKILKLMIDIPEGRFQKLKYYCF